MNHPIRTARALCAALAFISTLVYADYAEDRALIEDLQARYLFAFDFGDPEGYANTPEGERPRIGRHIINNIVIKVDGDTATSQAYWTHMTSNETGYGTVDFFGHYEDEMVKIDGDWYFSRRHVFNEAIPEWASEYVNPVTHKSPPPKERAPSQ